MIQLLSKTRALASDEFEFLGSPPGTAPGLVVCCCMRNEADILPSFLRFHYDQGVDFVLALDHESTDATRDILAGEAEAGRLAYARVSSPNYYQGEWMTELGRVAHELGARWVINADADEFWMPRIGTLGELFFALPESVNVVHAFHRNFLPPPEGDGFSAERQIYWDARMKGGYYATRKLFPKVAHRPGPGARVGDGNHWVKTPQGVTPLGWQVIDVLHFPLRSLSQLERRIAVKTRGWMQGPAKVAGKHMQRLAGRGRDGVEALFAEITDPKRIAKGLGRGDFVEDTRLAEFLASPEQPPAWQRLQRELQAIGSLLAARDEVGAVAVRPTVSPREPRYRPRKPFFAEVLGRGTFSNDWFSKNVNRWEPWVEDRADDPLRVLEIGSFEGLSSCYFLWRFPNASVTCVDTFAGSDEHHDGTAAVSAEQISKLEETFDANVALFDPERVRKIKADSRRALLDLLAEEAGFDFVYVDGSHYALDVIVDAALSWQLLAPGGILVFDDYGWPIGKGDVLRGPARGVEAFLKLVEGRCDVLFADYQVGLRKHRE